MECYPAMIQIGPIKRSDLESVLEMIVYEDLGYDWEGGPAPSTEEELLKVAGLNEGYLVLTSNDAVSGCFEGLENYLRDHDIAFDRQCGGYMEYDAEVVKFRPDLPEPWVAMGDMNTFRAYVSKDELEKMMEQISDMPVEEIVKALRNVIGPRIDPIPPFAIIEE